MSKISRPGRQGRNPGVYAVAVIIPAVVLGVLVYGIFFAPKPHVYDSQGCEEGHVLGHTVVIIDRTDPLSSSKHRAVKHIVTKLAEAMPTGDKLSIYEIDYANMKGLSVPSFELCRPRDGSGADPLTENPKLISMRFEQIFEAPLNGVLKEYQGGVEQKRSPIIECLMDIMHIPDFGPEVRRRRLVLFSDMLQHTEMFSHYTGVPDYAAFRRTNPMRQMMPSLRGVEVSVYYLLHDAPGALALQDNRHVKFWVDFFAAAGASVQHIEKVR